MQNTKNLAGNLLPQVFTFSTSNQPIRVEIINSQPYFVAKDVCDTLSIVDVSQAMERLDEDEKLIRVIHGSGQGRQMWLVNESGLYSLIFQSRKPEARAFRKWVTVEVLPAIRRTGGYQARKRLPYVFVDLRCKLFDTIELNGFPVRRVGYEEVIWYSLNDLLLSIGVKTSSSNIVRILNSKRENAIKILLYGSTNPGWFVNLQGVKLIISGSRFHKRENHQLLSKISSLPGGVDQSTVCQF